MKSQQTTNRLSRSHATRKPRQGAAALPSTPLAASVATLCVAVAIGHSFAPSALAATQTWTGTTDANWATGSVNWSGTSPSSGDSLVFTSATGAGGLTLVDNLMTPATYNVAGITFNAGAAAFVINPGTAGVNGFTLTGNVTNSSTSLQTINDAIALSGTNTFSLTTGGGNITLGGAIGGTGALKTSGTGILTLSGSNSYSGVTTINSAATLLIGSAGTVGTGAVSLSGTMVFSRSDSYTLASGNLVTGTGAVVLNSGTVSAFVDSQFNTTGPLVFGTSIGSTSVSKLDLTNGSSTFGGLLSRRTTRRRMSLRSGRGRPFGLAAR